MNDDNEKYIKEIYDRVESLERSLLLSIRAQECMVKGCEEMLQSIEKINRNVIELQKINQPLPDIVDPATLGQTCKKCGVYLYYDTPFNKYIYNCGHGDGCPMGKGFKI